MPLFLGFKSAALNYWLRLPIWQRERLAETFVSLLNNPRPLEARLIGPPEAYEVHIADRRVVYKIYTTDQGDDVITVIARV